MAESTKNDNNESPYLNEDEATTKNSRLAWAKSRAAKTVAIVAGGALALGAAFAVGATMGKNLGPGPEGQFGNHAPFDRDGDHPPKGGEFGDHRGPQGDHDGDHEGRGDDDEGFKLPADPNASTAPSTQSDDGTVNP